jgi:transcriptional regulator with XRE-family HTH domain
MPLHKYLQEMRDKAGLTQEELAERSGVHISTIRRYEQKGAKSHTFERLLAILRAVNGDIKQVILERDKDGPLVVKTKRRRKQK